MSLLEALVEPFTNGSLFMELLWIIVLYMVIASSLDLLIGYAGLFQLGHIGFFALGAVGTMLATHPERLGMDMVAGILLGFALTSAAVLLIGIPTLRLTGDYFAIATLGFATVTQALFIGLWARGIFGIPSLNPAGCDLECMAGTPVGAAIGNGVARALGNPGATTAGIELVIVWSISLTALWLLGRLKKSPFGRVLKSIREDRAAAEAMGKDTAKLRLQAFWISGLFASLVGSLTIHHLGLLDARLFSFQFMVLLIVMVIVGGLGSHSGAIIGAGLVAVFDQISRSVTTWMSGAYDTDLNLPALRLVFFAAILVTLMLVRPTGLLGDRELRMPWRKA